MAAALCRPRWMAQVPLMLPEKRMSGGEGIAAAGRSAGDQVSSSGEEAQVPGRHVATEHDGENLGDGFIELLDDVRAS